MIISQIIYQLDLRFFFFNIAEIDFGKLITIDGTLCDLIMRNN